MNLEQSLIYSVNTIVYSVNTIIFRNKNTTGFQFSNPVCLDHFTQGTYIPKICCHAYVTAID